MHLALSQRSSRMDEGTPRCACVFCCFSTAHVRPLPALLSDCVATARLPPPVSLDITAVCIRRSKPRRHQAATTSTAAESNTVASRRRNTRAPHRPPAAAVSPAASLPLPQPILPVLQHATGEVCNQYRRDALCAPAFSFRCSLRHNQPRRALRSGLSTRSTPLRHDRRSGRSLHTHSMVCRCFLLSAQLHNTETHSEMKFADEVCRSKPSTVPATLASKLLLLHHAPRQQNQDSKVSVSFESSRGRSLLLEEA